MKDRLARALANTLYASVGVVAYTSKKVAKGYNVVVEEGESFVLDVKTHYRMKKYPSIPIEPDVN
jgi:hypothetical protein